MYKIKLFLFGVINLFIFQTYGQSKVVTLELKNFNIEINGNRYDMDSIISEKMIQDVPLDILIYEADFISYRAVFTYKFKGRRAKLVRRTYALLPDGKHVYSKQKKDMQELKVSVPGIIKGKSSESILYMRKTMGNIFVSFNYELSYN